MGKTMLDSDTSESEESDVGVADGQDFKVNEEYARRFDYNKKREELRRLEEKLDPAPRKRKRHGDEEKDENLESAGRSSSSESEDEDDSGELATEALDSEIFATLNAIRSKDPRVYDPRTTFYTELDNEGEGHPVDVKKEKPMYLQDYHRENLLKNANGAENNTAAPQLTYNEEQEALKRSVVGEINAAAASTDVASDVDMKSGNDDGFLIAKPKTSFAKKVPPIALDVENADKDPETFLSNFLSARAWVSTTHDPLQPFESDDEEEDKRAEEFEQAYNFRFEDPAKSNEKLKSHARDMTSKYSVRRDEANPRKKRRDIERERKEAAKQELAEEKARLRKLKIEKLEEKLRKIRRAAGLKGTDLNDDEWVRFLDDGWDDTRWEEEMQKRFGDRYYEEEDLVSDESSADPKAIKRKRRLKKPRWDDDIEINDLVPDFDEEAEQANFGLSDSEPGEANRAPVGAESNAMPKKSTKDHKKERLENRKKAKRERQMVEQLVNDRLVIDTALLGNSRKAGTFHYRETSPVSYGLSAREILLAEDTQLNEFAGLKKLAAFRDPEKKRKDQKHLGKRARLRKWRKETFGDENGPQETDIASGKQGAENGIGQSTGAKDEVDVRTENRKRKRRSKKGKSAEAVGG